jgi:hypothetical protein
MERNIQKTLPMAPTTIDVIGAHFVCDMAHLQSRVWFSGVVVGVGWSSGGGRVMREGEVLPKMLPK